MKQKEVFNKIGGIIQELSEQYEYLKTVNEDLNDLELELFAANAHFLTDHIEVLCKLNLQSHAEKRATEKTAKAEKTEKQEKPPKNDEKETAHEQYLLSPDEVSELQQEGIQYYHRYISLFQLNDFPGVIRDTQRNIDLFNFVHRHGGAEEYAHSLEQFRPYVIMMNTRARASIDLERGDFAGALRQIERGREKIAELFNIVESPDAIERSPEIAFLDEWMEEIREHQPLTKLEKMQREMEAAIANEAYERAAELRDAIRAQTARKKEKSAELRSRGEE